MDIVSHGLWASAASKLAEKKERKINPYWAFFWGVFPDLFAFTAPFAVLLYSIVVGQTHFSQWPHPDATEPSPENTLPLATFTHTLYSFSHSIVIFGLVFLLVYIITKRVRFELFGWLLHILCDIPTHRYDFYPTPFLWPVSDLKVGGFSWATPWFMILNYCLLFVVYYYIRKRKKNNDK